MARPDDLLPSIFRRIAIAAERRPRQAVRLARRAVDASPADARGWLTLGWALLCWDRAGQARPYLEQAHDYYAQQEPPLAPLYTRHLLLLADVWDTDRPGLELAFAELAAEYERRGAALPAARARLDQARQLNVLGRPAEAIHILERIEHPLATLSILDRTRWLRARAIAAIYHSDFRPALRWLEESIGLAKRHGYSIDAANAQVERAWCMLRQERFDDALAFYRDAEEVYRRHDLPLRLAYSARNIGVVSMYQGRYDQALAAYLNAQRYFAALQRRGNLGGIHLNLGNLHYFTARWDAALAHYLRAETLFLERGMVNDALVAQRNRAMVYRHQQRRAAARRLLDQVETQRQEQNDASEIAEIWSIRAALFADERRWRAARRMYQRAAAAFAELENSAAAAECALEQAWIDLETECYGEASRLLSGIGAALDDRPHHRWRADYGLARCHLAGAHPEQALPYFARAITTVGALRRSLKSEHASSALANQSNSLYHDALACAAAAGDHDQLLAFSEAYRAAVLGQLLTSDQTPASPELADAQERLRRAVVAHVTRRNARPGAQLDAILNEYGELLLQARHSARQQPAEPPGAPFDLRQIRTMLAAAFGDDWTIITYVSVNETLYLITITPRALSVDTAPNDEQLSRAITRLTDPQYHAYLFRDIAFALGQTTIRWATHTLLADRLLPPIVRARLHPGHRLLIVPSGALHGLPWATLRLNDAWLAEQAIIQILPSLNTIGALARWRGANGAALLIGCSATHNRADELPAVQVELPLVASRLSGSIEILRDQAATRAAVLDRSRHRSLDVLHLACHATLVPQRGLAAHLALWDDVLLLPDIAGLQLDGTLVVLSACEGATPDTLAGDEVLSLGWGFLMARAGAVIASQWSVRDDTTPLLMDMFYQALHEFADPALALTATQRRLIALEARGIPTAAAEQWGSFICIGRGNV